MLNKINYEIIRRAAEENPEAFKMALDIVIKEFIRSASPENQQALRQLQWRIDGDKLRAKTPLGASIKIQKKMMEKFLELLGNNTKLLTLFKSMNFQD